MMQSRFLLGWLCRVRCRLFKVVLTVVLTVVMYMPTEAQDRTKLAVTDFDFIDTSGEPRDQKAEHARRLQAFGTALANSLSTSERLLVTRLDCENAPCSGRHQGLATLATKAIEANARFLLVGEVRKMSTLIGGVKFAVMDMTSNRPSCDRFLSYRGDTDEAWQRAAAFTARDVVKHCLR